jgi:hypothetical protein
MRRRRQPLQVSTFPFLAVLLCAMGSLLLLLLVIDRRAKAVARARVEQAAARAAAEDARAAAARRAEWEERRRALHELLAREEETVVGQLHAVQGKTAAAATEIRAEQARFRELRERLEAETGRLARKREDLSARRARAAEAGAKAEASQQELAQLAAELDRLEQTMRDLRALREREKQTYSLVPYIGRHGDSRRPIYVECTAGGVVFHPDRVVLEGPGLTPLALRAEVERRIAGRHEAVTAVADKKETSPYLLMLVRPDGIVSYYQTQAALVGLKIDFGYEFVERDWILDFSSDDDSAPPQPWMTAGKVDPRVAPRPASEKRAPRTAPPGGAVRREYLSPGGPPDASLVGGPPQAGRVVSGGTFAPPGSGPGAVESPVGGPGGGGSGAGATLLQPRAYAGGRGENSTGSPQAGPGGDGSPFRWKGGSGGAGGQTSPNAGPGRVPPEQGPWLSPRPDRQPAGGFPSFGPGLGPTAGAEGGTGPGTLGIGGHGTETAKEDKGKGTVGDEPSAANVATRQAATDGPTPPATGGLLAAAGKEGVPTAQVPGSNGPGRVPSGTSAGSGDRTLAPAGTPGQANPGGPGEHAEGRGDAGEGPGLPVPRALAGTPLAGAQARPIRSPPLPLSRLLGNRDWPIVIECRADEVVLRITGLRVPVGSLTAADPADQPLVRAVQRLIAERQATIRPGEPPYRPLLRLLVNPDGLRSYYLAYPQLEALGLPMTRENVEPPPRAPRTVDR